jgi:hypothetical protein
VADFDPILAIRRAAMLAVHREPVEYKVREIQRWYSETFHTPLEAVEEMDFERVALHYFERMYRDMTPEEREDEMRTLSETEEQRLDRLRREEADKVSDEDFLKQVKADAENAANAARTLAGQLKKMPPGEQEPIVPVPVMGSAIPTTFADQPSKALPEGIDMKFVSEEEMEEMGNWDLFGPATRSDK